MATKVNALKYCQELLATFKSNLVPMVVGTPSTKIVQITLIGVKYDHRGRGPFFYVSIGETYFFIWNRKS